METDDIGVNEEEFLLKVREESEIWGSLELGSEQCCAQHTSGCLFSTC